MNFWIFVQTEFKTISEKVIKILNIELGFTTLINSNRMKFQRLTNIENKMRLTTFNACFKKTFVKIVSPKYAI